MSTLDIRYGPILRSGGLVLEPGRISVRAPAAIAVVGINGSGKTSLFMQLTGTLLSARSASSHIRLNGEQATLAYVPQTAALPDWLRVRDLAAAFGVDWRALVAAMPQLALHEIPCSRLGRLSPGQRQAVALAVALARRADLTILDEPFSALDFRRRAGALELFRDRTVAGRSLILSAPSASDFAGLCGHVVVLHGGRCVFSGPMSDLSASGAAADVERELLRLVR